MPAKTDAGKKRAAAKKAATAQKGKGPDVARAPKTTIKPTGGPTKKTGQAAAAKPKSQGKEVLLWKPTLVFRAPSHPRLQATRLDQTFVFRFGIQPFDGLFT